MVIGIPGPISDYVTQIPFRRIELASAMTLCLNMAAMSALGWVGMLWIA